MGLLLNRAKANTATTGTGAVTPGSAVSPYQAWSAAGAVTGYWYSYLIEDGAAAWETGVGLYNGTTITRPGPGVDPQFASSSGSLLNLSGTATIACVANKNDIAIGAPFMPPAASYFGAISGNSPTIADSAALGLTVTGAGGGTVVRYGCRALPGVDFTATFRVTNPNLFDGNSAVGFCLRDNSGGRMLTYAPCWRGAWNVNALQWNNSASANSDLANFLYNGSSIWLRTTYHNAAKTLDGWASYDTVYWRPVFTANAWVSNPSHYGVCTWSTNAAGNPSGTFTYWQEQ